MSKQSLLLVDHDTRSMRVLEVSLRKAGFTVTTAISVADALEKLEHPPDLIISETTFPAEQADGFELRRRIRGMAEWAEIPFIFLTAEQTIENKIRGLELGVDDYLTKPIYIKEIVTRINILLQKRQRVRFEERRDGRTRFAGRVADMPVVDVIQTIEISRKSGVIQFVGERGRQAAIYFRDGRVIDAEAGALQGEDAVYRLLTWSEGEFEVVFRTVRRREVITTSSQGLLMEGMRRLDEWSRLLEQLPPLTHRFEVDANELALRLGDVPDNNNGILRLIDGKRTLLEVIDGSDVGDLECLQAISRLYFEEMLLDLDHGRTARRDTGRPIAAMTGSTSGPTPVRVASGPLDDLDDLGEDVTPSQPIPALTGSAPIDRASGSIPVDEGDIRESADAVVSMPATDSDEPPGPFMGSYRPSSLRLIDEAVAAAQAIEPSLFEDDTTHRGTAPASPAAGESPRSVEAPSLVIGAAAPYAAIPSGPVQITPASALPGLVRLSAKPVIDDEDRDDARDESSSSIVDEAELDYPNPIDADDPTPMPVYRRKSKPPPLDAKAGRDDSGLRMIGSLGRDRAEASGELAFGGGTNGATVTQTQRELVTILPRRTTREVPALTPADEAKAQADAAKVTGSLAAASSAATAKPLGDVKSTAAKADATPASPAPAKAGGAKTSASGATSGEAKREPRALPVDPPRTVTPIGDRVSEPPRKRGTSGLAKLFAVGVLAVAGLGIYSLTRSKPAPTATRVDAGSFVVADGAVVEDAVEVASVIDGGVADAQVLAPRDAAVPRDARAPGSAGVEAALDPMQQAKLLYEQANAALLDGDAEKALRLVDAALKLRKTARAHLIRATALQRLDRIDEAVQATVSAEKLSPVFAQIFDQRGRILWSARRFDEARVAFEKYLTLDPTGKRAAEVRRLLDRPQ